MASQFMTVTHCFEYLFFFYSVVNFSLSMFLKPAVPQTSNSQFLLFDFEFSYF